MRIVYYYIGNTRYRQCTKCKSRVKNCSKNNLQVQLVMSKLYIKAKYEKGKICMLRIDPMKTLQEKECVKFRSDSSVLGLGSWNCIRERELYWLNSIGPIPLVHSNLKLVPLHIFEYKSCYLAIQSFFSLSLRKISVNFLLNQLPLSFFLLTRVSRTQTI